MRACRTSSLNLDNMGCSPPFQMARVAQMPPISQIMYPPEKFMGRTRAPIAEQMARNFRILLAPAPRFASVAGSPEMMAAPEKFIGINRAPSAAQIARNFRMIFAPAPRFASVAGSPEIVPGLAPGNGSSRGLWID